MTMSSGGMSSDMTMLMLTATRRGRDCFPAWGPGGDSLRSVVATNTVVHTYPLQEGCLRTPGLDNGNLAVMGFQNFQYAIGRRLQMAGMS